ICTSWPPARRRTDAPSGRDHREDRGSGWLFPPNRRTVSRRPCVPDGALHLACGASAGTARKSGNSDSHRGWPAGTPPRATAGLRVDAAVAAGADPRSLALAARLVVPVSDRRTRQLPAGPRPNPRQAATPLRQLRLVAGSRVRFRAQSSNCGRSLADPGPLKTSIEELL